MCSYIHHSQSSGPKVTVLLFFMSYHNSIHPGNRMKAGESEKEKEKKAFFLTCFVSLESSRREILAVSKHSSNK
jgi:hypothetical protein